MSILPSFISNDIVKKSKDEATIIEMPKEYGIDYATGQLTGEIVEGIEAIKTWVWLCLHIERYRYPIYPWNYGCELEQYIGQVVTDEYLQTDCRAEIEEALTVNPWITGISNFSASIQTGKLRVKFTVLTKIGEVDINV